MKSEYLLLFEEHEKNHRWFDENYEELVKKYDKEFVAIYGQKLLDHDERLETLMGRVRQKYQGLDVFVEFVTSEKRVLVL